MTEHQREKTIEMRKAGCGYAEIAKELSVSRDTVKTFCRRKNITVDSIDAPKEIGGICLECGKSIVQMSCRKPKRFCSAECRQKWWNAHPERIGKKAVYEYICPNCSRPFTAYGNSHRKYCSHECYVSARFKGGEAYD